MPKQDKSNKTDNTKTAPTKSTPAKAEKPKKSDGNKKTTIILICVAFVAVAAVIAIVAGALGLFASTPALQRSQRDVTRRNDVVRLETALVQYQTNNAMKRNNLPTLENWDKFLQDYDLATMSDPNSLGEPYTYHLCTYGDLTCANPLSLTDENIGEIYVYYSATCSSSEDSVLEPSSSRRFAILTPLEDDELYCVNN